MSEIKYVQLEAAAFLSDSDFQLMTAEERGVYCTVIFYMLANDGFIKNEPERIAALCNCRTNFDECWRVVRNKFVSVSEADLKASRKYPTEKLYLTHKRVRKELAKARKSIKQKSLAGKASGQLRQSQKKQPFNGRSTAAELSKDKISKDKISKDKISKTKEKEVKEKAKALVHFDAFWKLYPRKQGKEKALQSWLKLEPTAELFETILTAVAAQKKSEQWEQKKYIPHPTTWLNQKRWTDEVIPKENQTRVGKTRPKIRLFPITGKVCGTKGCRLPAVYKDSSGPYDNFYCAQHMPAKVKEMYV